MVLLLWGGAFGVDLGLTVVGGRQVQTMADTAALDMARYINVADWNTTISVTGPRAEHQLPQRQAGLRRHRQRFERHTHRDPGRVAERQLHPGGSEDRRQPDGPMLVLQPSRCPSLQRGQGHGDTVRAADLRRRSLHGDPVLHRRRSRRSPASPSAPTWPPSTRSNRPSSTPCSGTLGGPANVTRFGYQGLANTNVTINQLITASGGLLTTSNVHDEAGLTGVHVAVDLERWPWPTRSPRSTAARRRRRCRARPAQRSAVLNATDLTPSTQVELCQLVSINGSLVLQRQPLTQCRPSDQPQRAADVHDRSRGSQRDSGHRPRDLARASRACPTPS